LASARIARVARVDSSLARDYGHLTDRELRDAHRRYSPSALPVLTRDRRAPPVVPWIALDRGAARAHVRDRCGPEHVTARDDLAAGTAAVFHRVRRVRHPRALGGARLRRARTPPPHAGALCLASPRRVAAAPLRTAFVLGCERAGGERSGRARSGT